MSPELEAALTKLRKHLHDTEPDPGYREAHAKGCFTDQPNGTLCAVCGGDLFPESSGVRLSDRKLT